MWSLWPTRGSWWRTSLPTRHPSTRRTTGPALPATSERTSRATSGAPFGLRCDPERFPLADEVVSRASRSTHAPRASGRRRGRGATTPGHGKSWCMALASSTRPTTRRLGAVGRSVSLRCGGACGVETPGGFRPGAPRSRVPRVPAPMRCRNYRAERTGYGRLGQAPGTRSRNWPRGNGRRTNGAQGSAARPALSLGTAVLSCYGLESAISSSTLAHGV